MRVVLAASLAALVLRAPAARRPPRAADRHRRAAPADLHRRALPAARRQGRRASSPPTTRSTSAAERAELDAYLQAARAAGVRVLLGFGHSRDPLQAHTAAVGASASSASSSQFRARYPWVRDYLTWNEANHCSQPTCKQPEARGAVLPRAAQALRGLPDRRRRRARRVQAGAAGCRRSRRRSASAA